MGVEHVYERGAGYRFGHPEAACNRSIPAQEFIETAAQQAAAFAVPRGHGELAAPENAVQNAISQRCGPLKQLLDGREDYIDKIIGRAADLVPPDSEHRDVIREQMTAWLLQFGRAAD